MVGPVIFDAIKRYLTYSGYQVTLVINVTDVDDKLINEANRRKMAMPQLAAEMTADYMRNLEAMGVDTVDQFPRATDNMAEIISFTSDLIRKGCAYESEGDVYFDVAKAHDYGKLSHRSLDSMQGEGGDTVERKRNSADFALWKRAKPGEPSWPSPWGPGRPGWHIECSAMSMEYLGDSFDLHAGGEDLMFPHHENEIAQSETATGKPFARHWMHVRFLLVDGRKMSKSEGNFYTLRDLLLKGYKASAIRLALVSVPYRHQLNFTFEGLTEATNAIDRLRTFHLRLTTGTFPAGSNSALETAAAKAQTDYREALANDLNTAEARAPIFDLIRTANTAIDRGQLFLDDRDRILAVLADFDRVFDVIEDHDAEPTQLALAWAEREGRAADVALELRAAQSITDAEVDALIAERTLAKKQRNFARADAIRIELQEKGIVIEDSKDGVRWKRK
jgi:cysteinyl-tRNA synthetase